MPVGLDSDPGWLLRDAMDNAARFEIAIYDAVYLALLNQLDCSSLQRTRSSRPREPGAPFVHYLGELNP
jgi:hypothetical protein